NEVVRRVVLNRRRLSGCRGTRDTGLPFLLLGIGQAGHRLWHPNSHTIEIASYFRIQEPDMLQDISTPTWREASPGVLETERLLLRTPTLADVKAIARRANDRRIAMNTRRLPHPYSQDDAIEFVRRTASEGSDTVFLVENDLLPIGGVGMNWHHANAPELGYWLGVEHWQQGFANEATRALIDVTFEGFELALVI